MSAIWGSEIVKSGLVLYLDAGNQNSYPGTGTTWTDISQNNNNGTLTNGPTFNSANGGSIVLDGTNDYITYNLANPFAETIIVWIRSATVNWNAFGWIACSRSQNGHIIHPDVDTKVVTFYLLNSGGFNISIGSATPTDITIPHMYAYSTNGSNLHKVYLDGIEVASSTTAISRTTTPSSQNCFLGVDSCCAGRNGNGNIYNAIRYNRALTATEILQNYNATKARFGL
jgi:hypothetical protein